MPIIPPETNPKESWNMIFKLVDGFQMHHRNYVERNFKSKDGKIAENDSENAEILKMQFSSLFNSHTEADFSVIYEIPNHITQHILGEVQLNQRSRKPYLRWLAIKLPASLASPRI
jgi:hypothetical protein